MPTLLDKIIYPTDLRKLPPEDLPELAKEIRSCLLQNIAQSGGHFASNLGAVELTIALHYVFDTPHDHLVWDVGHQTYAHKLLTGRKDRLHTIRQHGGLSPFPKIDESIYDTVGVGHSSTSIGVALGLAIADQIDGNHYHSIAVIGDGAMTAGMAFEALNNAGHRPDLNLLVILNDNEMSISNNVGALPKYLARSLMQDVKEALNTVKLKTTPVLEKIPLAINTAQHIENKVSQLLHKTRSGLSLFNDFGFHYNGLFDGNNVLALVKILRHLQTQSGPQLLHIHTQKGRGFTPAENDPIGFHSIATFDIKHPPQAAIVDSCVTYSKIFGDWCIDQATVDERFIAITPAMREGSGLIDYEKRFPQRYFDVGIAEQHAVTFAAGLALGGKKPVVAIYSTFLQRAYDQLIHDVAIQKLPVMFAIDRAGVVGKDGPTHIGAYDISFLRCIPNLIIATPSDERECRLLLSTCYQANMPSAIRYPRGQGPGINPGNDLTTVAIGKGLIRRYGKKVALLNFGHMLETACEIGEKIDATVADMRFVKPIDKSLIMTLAQNHDYLVSLEENAIMGGAGSAVLEVLAKQKNHPPVLILGIPDVVTTHGDTADIKRDIGLDVSSLLRRIYQFIGKNSPM